MVGSDFITDNYLRGFFSYKNPFIATNCFSGMNMNTLVTGWTVPSYFNFFVFIFFVTISAPIYLFREIIDMCHFNLPWLVIIIVVKVINEIAYATLELGVQISPAIVI